MGRNKWKKKEMEERIENLTDKCQLIMTKAEHMESSIGEICISMVAKTGNLIPRQILEKKSTGH